MEMISNPTHDKIKKAAKALKDGHLVAFPTETVYGLGADATNEKAISRIYSVKGRPTDHPLIVHISSINQLDKWAIDIPDYAIKLARLFWPGPMTLILKRSNLAKNFITGEQDNVGVRVPAHPIALELLHEFEKLGGLGVAAPSANRFGAVSPTSLEAVVDEVGNYLSRYDQMLDGGESKIGIESTIINCTKKNPNILRPGFITIDLITQTTHLEVPMDVSRSALKVPGMFSSHYSPKAKVYLGSKPRPGWGYLALDFIQTPRGTYRLASPKDETEFAKVLYLSLRLADNLKIKHIVVVPPEGTGIALAIRDRLKKMCG